ncbi:MAG: acyl carrier protein, partial [Pseudomonadota bacterium]
MSDSGMREERRHQEQHLLIIINTLVSELRGPGGGRAHLDSIFDRDLGLDSLARVELVLRVERAFAVSLPESALGEAETARALLAIIVAASVGRAAGRPADFIIADNGPGRGAPVRAATLVEVLEWHVAAEPDRVHIYLYSGD